MNAFARRETLAAPVGYDLLTAIEDQNEPGGFYVHAVPVVAFEVDAAGGPADREVIAVALDGDTCSSSDKAVRAPDGRVVSMCCDTHPDTSAWLQSVRASNEKAAQACAIRSLV